MATVLLPGFTLSLPVPLAGSKAGTVLPSGIQEGRKIISRDFFS